MTVIYKNNLFDLFPRRNCLLKYMLAVPVTSFCSILYTVHSTFWKMSGNEPQGQTGGRNQEGEGQPLIEDFHDSFRRMREKRMKTGGENFAITIIKVFFCVAGFWLPSRCCSFYVVWLLLISIFQLIYDLFTVLNCPNFNCRFLIDKDTHKNPSRAMQNATYTLASIGGLFSYVLMIMTLYLAQRKKNALRPKMIIELDVKKKHLQFLASLSTTLVSCWVASTTIFFYIVRNQISFTSKFAILATGVGSQLVTQLTAIIACFVFAAASLAIGKYFDLFPFGLYALQTRRVISSLNIVLLAAFNIVLKIIQNASDCSYVLFGQYILF